MHPLVLSLAHSDLLHRLEYLAVTGESPTWQLMDVFKPSNNMFSKKHRGFRAWLNARAARREQMMKRAAAVAAVQSGRDAASLITDSN